MHLDPNIRIRNSPIPVVNEIRFLGVILDRKLTFLPHVLHLRKKCEKSLNILKVLSKTSWGADRTSLLRIYQAVILSLIDYGCMVYGSARPTLLRRLDTVHHSALRIFSGAFRTSPVESLYVICHQLPLLPPQGLIFFRRVRESQPRGTQGSFLIPGGLLSLVNTGDATPGCPSDPSLVFYFLTSVIICIDFAFLFGFCLHLFWFFID
ncbi:hypothetical protein AVEN_229721-1 [Araneus ventricosus]|uniref:Reverse transcriptase domain-containing protein n=1 Tax=Araneus ventricosus TaxID=182803 RepID=A0A4Y2WKM1_ARAVE|nr:hypothetical protein AVEN_229721-1 [Araneus ventricosus]